MTQDITLQSFMDTLNEVVDEAGEGHKGSSRVTEDGCIVARVLHRMGHGDRLQRDLSRPVWPAKHWGGSLLQAAGIYNDHALLGLADEASRQNDQHVTWGILRASLNRVAGYHGYLNPRERGERVAVETMYMRDLTPAKKDHELVA